MSSARVVITGLGSVSPLGLTVGDMWDGLCAGRCGIGRIAAFDPVGFSCQIAGQVPDFKVQQFVPKSYRKAVKLMSRDIKLAVAAADEALRSAGLVTKGIDPENVNVDPERVAINLGAGLISCDLVELGPAVAASAVDGKFDIRKWGREGLELVTPLWLLKYLPNMLACHIGIIHDIEGPSNSITCAEASAHLAIGEATQIISRGDSDVALAGGAEAKVNPIIMIRQCLVKRATSQNNDNPESACRPFDANAAGSVQPEDLDLIMPHGTGIACDDLAEASAIEAALGEAATEAAVWPTKSMLSNTGAASGALDVIAAVCAIRDGKIPAAKNCDNKANGCNLNIANQMQQKDIRYALCCSYTYGGQTAAIVLKRFDSEMAN